MSRTLVIAATLLAAAIANSSNAISNDFWSKDELRNSSWNSAYTTANGNQVHAQVKFNGNRGTYDTQFGQGRLSDIQYEIDTASMPGRPFFQITGTWSFQGESGPFLFSSNGRNEFKGSWQGNNGNGKWSGTAMYGQWQKDPDRDRLFCEYRYPAKDNPSKINIQIMIWYPNDAQRSGYYYFANKDNQIWGRCVCPKNPAYDPGVMQWSKLMNESWNELPKGDCPSPKDGDPKRAAIDKIPDPPA